jgi:hypothetical protein
MLMDAVVWAFRHTEKNVAETGLQLCLELFRPQLGERDRVGAADA